MRNDSEWQPESNGARRDIERQPDGFPLLW
jgi:hypothetical protein